MTHTDPYMVSDVFGDTYSWRVAGMFDEYRIVSSGYVVVFKDM